MIKLKRNVLIQKRKMPSDINKIIDEFVNGVREILGGRMKKIILYGSYARRRL